MHRQNSRWISIPTAIVLLLLIAMIMNPELRALLLLANGLGLDLVALLFAMQLKQVGQWLLPAVGFAAALLCLLAAAIGSRALRAYPRASAFWPLDRLVGPALLFMSYGIRCRVSG